MKDDRDDLSAARWIIELLERGVELWAEGDKLRYLAARGVVTAESRRALARHKAEIVELLGQRRKHAQLSFAQTRLWLIEQLGTSDAAYRKNRRIELKFTQR